MYEYESCLKLNSQVVWYDDDHTSVLIIHSLTSLEVSHHRSHHQQTTLTIPIKRYRYLTPRSETASSYNKQLPFGGTVAWKPC